MKNKKMNIHTEKNFEYDLLLYRDIEMDLKKVKTSRGKRTKLLKGQKIKPKKKLRTDE